jgi:hypothetical protein
MRTRYKTSTAWHAQKRSPLPEGNRAPTKLFLPTDAFELAAMHKRLIDAHRYADANVVLARLRELATRPDPVEVNTHQFVVGKQATSIPFVF